MVFVRATYYSCDSTGEPKEWYPLVLERLQWDGNIETCWRFCCRCLPTDLSLHRSDCFVQEPFSESAKTSKVLLGQVPCRVDGCDEREGPGADWTSQSLVGGMM